MRVTATADGDEEQLKVVSERAIRETVEATDAEKEEFVAHTAGNIVGYIGKPESVFLKCEADGQIVGYILVKSAWNLSDLFVLPDYQRRGVGTRLLRKAIDACRSKGLGYLRLNAANSALAYYRKFGFTESTSRPSKTPSTTPLELRFSRPEV